MATETGGNGMGTDWGSLLSPGFAWTRPWVAEGSYATDLNTIVNTHFREMFGSSQQALRKNVDAISRIAATFSATKAGVDLFEYLTDAGWRSVLYLDVLNKRSKRFLEHERGRAGTVLIWDHEVVIDGSRLKRPVNYSLVRIIPQQSTVIKEHARPYIIIDPRAGHGSGIGGFKHESEVGCAINAGHPVYFVIFTRLPEPGQTLSDVCAAEAEFVREVNRRHRGSPKPVIIGNCQGGWAAMLLAATNPEITGPVVANGAPLSYWAGAKGKSPIRYQGVFGGITSALFLCDLGNGLFDGAYLVSNFERLSPSKTWWQKYYDLYSNIDGEAERFLEFESWWSAFYFMTEDEIRWILENLFIGNKLARGEANLDARNHLDLRNIQSPIIIFASHGDNITPPQQALAWIADNYADVEEIRTRGARIVYTLHPSVGHLGIFVSSQIAKKEHHEIVSTLEAIEALAPGLYEMAITDEDGEGEKKRFQVAFEERSIDEVMRQAGGTDDETPFAALARLSEFEAEVYNMTVRPCVKAMANQPIADSLTAMHPSRAIYYALSDFNPAFGVVHAFADIVKDKRVRLDAENPFVRMEHAWADMVSQWWDGVRDLQTLFLETTFYLIYGAPPIKALGERRRGRISDAPQEDLRSLANVQVALDRLDIGDFAEGVIRMLILLAKSRHEVRRSRLERSSQVLNTREPFASMKPKHRTRIIFRETLIVDLEPEAALASLPKLLKTREEREEALSLCWEIAGPEEEMAGTTSELMDVFANILDVSPRDVSMKN
jgi:poly(3-hydroxyalkanoate) synthetase